MNSHLAVVQQQVVSVPETSWIGNMSMAGVGLTLLGLSFLCIRGREVSGTREPIALWGPLFGSLGDRFIGAPSIRLYNSAFKRNDCKGFDWRSAMTFSFGLFGMTAVLSSQAGTVLSLMQWAQEMVLKFANWPIISDLGAAGLCVFLGFLAMRNRGDDMKDLSYGALCGLIWPLGGGWAAGITFHVGHWIPQLLHLG